MSTLRGSASKVQAELGRLGLDCEVMELASTTRTAPEAAAAIGCDVAQIAKSIVFRTVASATPVLVVASGSDRIDEKRVREHVGEKVRKADADFTRAATGFAIGGVPPLAREGLVRVFDRNLLGHDVVWAAAGTPFAVVRLTRGDLRRLAGDEFAALARVAAG